MVPGGGKRCGTLSAGKTKGGFRMSQKGRVGSGRTGWWRLGGMKRARVTGWSFLVRW